MTTVSKTANLPNCILNQLTLPAVVMFSNSSKQLYKNFDLSGFQDIGFWDLESDPTYIALQPTFTTINSIGNDVSIAVSQTNKWILAITAPISNFYIRSTDGGNTWFSLVAPATPASWQFIGFGNDIWLLGQSNGPFWTSPSADVASWTLNAYTFPDVGFIRAGHFRNGDWVIVSSGGDIAHSTNGTTWANANTTIFTACRDVEFSFPLSNWMAVGIAGGVGRAAISTDGGVTWILTTGLLANCTSALTVEYHQNAWIVGGIASTGLGLWRSTDNGVNWTQLTAVSTGLPSSGQIANLDEVGELRDTVIAMSTTDAQIYFSRNGLNWLQFQLGPFAF